MATTFFQELRQRKIVRGAALYMVVAWIIAQAGEMLTEALSLPSWTLTLILLLLVLGFPVALVLSWIFDITPQGIVRDSEIDKSQTPPDAGRIVDFVIIGILTVAVGYFGWAYFARQDAAPVAATGHSIAVLPFDNLSGDASKDYFSDGVTEELLNALAKIPELKVAARTSSFFFKDKQEDTRRIGEQLGVDMVLEGSVRQDGDQVRITAQLINAEDGFHLWSQTFDYQLDNIFAVQDDIARAVVKELKLTLLGDTPISATPRPTDNPEAYQAYMRGRYELHRRVEESIIRSTEHFRAAVTADPGYADAWVGLAESFVLQYTNHRLLPREEAIEKADNAISHALDLNPDSAAAQAALGLLRMEAKDLDVAQRAFERSIALNPRYAEAWHWYGLLQQRRGDLDDSYEKLKKAVEIDPLHPVARANVGQNLLMRGRLEEATAFFERSTDLDPDFPSNYLMLGVIEANRPYYDPKKALAWTNAALARGADNIEALSLKAGLYMTLMDFDAVDNTVATMVALKPQHPNVIFARIMPWLHDGEDEKAAAFLDETLAARGENLDDTAHVLSAIANVLRGDHKNALAAWYRFHPALDDEVPRLNHDNYQYATLVAWSLYKSDQSDRGTRLLDALEEFCEVLPEFGPKGRQLTLVETATLRGDYDLALRRLEQAVADGYRNRLTRNSWTLDKYPLFEPLWERPDFQRVVATIDTYTQRFL